ncbi:hypothetical protein ELH93_29095 (plasmid) [Rhizobium leguminosarum]|uniref:hypothetical protein n=1 Tax=Rhizobium leguminosarum TaxID=384 RepID=UPI0010326532|nr:hypothetical protein [Rhizobium leguminosarum]TAY27782.1 hypothetical protein ELH93_29095 [Rhizobium leguminosarum]
MRSQKREFVVEYKTRRRTQFSPKSIWSGIDLKSASKAVEADADLLFKQLDPVPTCVDNTTSLKPASTSEPATLPSVSLAKCDSPLSANASQPIAAETDKVVAQVRSDRLAKPQAQAWIRASTGRGGEWDPIAVNDSVISNEELRELEAENARLKLALKTRLLRDNAVLQAMLERFER